MPPDFGVVRADDFARAIGAPVSGSATTGVASGVRAAIPLDEYWSDLRGLPVGGNRGTSPLPTENNGDTRGGEVANNDANKPARVNPRIDTSPSLGAVAAPDLAKEVLPAMTLAQYRATKDAR
jgi:hypothetical protein